MRWLNGFSTCSRLGIDDCVVWWDAWTVVISLAALVVSAIAAAAVAYLGWQANQQSKAAHAASQNLASAEKTRRDAEEARHERVILTYVEVDLDSIEMWSRPLIERLNDVDKPEFEEYIINRAFRSKERELANALEFDRLQAMIPSFHHCSAEVATRLARAIGSVEVVRRQLRRNADWADCAPEDVERKKDWRVVYKLMCKRLRVLHADALFCGRKARHQLYNLDG